MRMLMADLHVKLPYDRETLLPPAIRTQARPTA